MGSYMAAIWRCRYFWLSLVKNDLRTRYRRSVLGMGWSLLHPICMTTILTAVFCKLFHQSISDYAPFVLAGLATWNYVLTVVQHGCHCFFIGESYIRQYPAPLAIYPLRTALGGTVHFLLALSVVLLLSTVAAAIGSINFVTFEATYTPERSPGIGDYEIGRRNNTSYDLPTAYIRFLFEYTSDASAGSIVDFQDAEGRYKCALHLGPANTLVFYDTDKTVVGSGTTLLAPGQVYAISAKVGTGSNAAWEIRINEDREMSGVANLGNANNGSLKLATTYNYQDVSINSHAWSFQRLGVIPALATLVPTIILLFIFAWSAAVLAGVANVYFQDTQHLTEVAFQMLFYATPIIYHADQLQKNNLGWLVNANPLVSLLDLIRQPILDGQIPSLTTYGMAITTVVVTLLAAAWTLSRLQKRLIFYL
jgi:ABC-type polysaccharide/polyol phosphate export permease